jgi:hypothetical protein
VSSVYGDESALKRLKMPNKRFFIVDDNSSVDICRDIIPLDEMPGEFMLNLAWDIYLDLWCHLDDLKQTVS